MKRTLALMASFASTRIPPLNLIPFYLVSHGTRTEYGASGSTAENSECGAAGFVGSLGFALGSFERENGHGAGGSWTWRAAQGK